MTSFLDMLGAPRLDLRKRYVCKLCGVKITRKNFAMVSNTFLGEQGWSESSIFCENAQAVLCKRYLKEGLNSSECPHCGKVHESPEEMLERVSYGNEDYYNLLASHTILSTGVQTNATRQQRLYEKYMDRQQGENAHSHL